MNKILQLEFSYQFTNDKEFLSKYSNIKITNKNDDTIQEAINEYFKIIIRNVRNNIPKIIQYKLINNLEKILLNKFSEHLYTNQEILKNLVESEEYTTIRNNLKKSKEELEKLLKKIFDTPEISDELFRKENYEEKQKTLQKLEKENRDKLFKESLNKLKKIRNKEDNNIRKEDIKETLESMCIIGDIVKENIIEEQKKCPEKFIPIKEALENTDIRNPVFCLGLLANNLEDQGIMTVIEKEEPKTEEEKELSISTLDFIVNGMINTKKYDLHFDFGEERNEELLFNIYEQKKFNDKIKKKISEEFGIPDDKIILTSPQKGSYKISFFLSEEFNSITLDKAKQVFQNDSELYGLKEIQEDIIIKACKLTKDMLDYRGNRDRGWGKNEKRGTYPYYPPEGWIGYGLKVLGRYDNGNDDWLDYHGKNNEWAVAYHGIGDRGGVGEVNEAVNSIIKGGLKKGKRQVHKRCSNLNQLAQDYKNVGEGVYCSPNPKVLGEYGALYKSKFKMGLMLRVKPDRIRYCNCENKEYWVLNGTSNEIRPYRILIKDFSKK